MKGATQLVVLLALTSAALAADCHSWREQGQPNLNPIYRKAPVFVNSVANGALYTVGEGDDLVKVVHLWGTPYEKGFAHGSLVQKEAAGLINDAWSYFTDEVIQAINNTGHSLHIPQPIIDWIADVGLEAALDITYELTKPFTGSYFYEEMHGLADGAQIDYKTLRRVHMIGELTRGTCSMFGAWGNATASIGGRLLQLRALDWAVDGPFKNYPQITVYHANNSNEYSYANVGWSGWIGLITGISENQMGVSEIGVAYPDATFGNESRSGIPFTNILKDVLQFDNSWTAAVSRISNANRTCDLILGVGDGKATQFRGIAYSHSTANFYTDTDMEPTADWHPRIPNIVYYGMDWICPAFNRMMAAQLTQYYGNITADNTVAYVTSIVQTGDLHVAIYDLAKLGLYVANARADYEGGPDNAYDRTFVFLDMTEAFAVPQPGSNQLPIAASVM